MVFHLPQEVVNTIKREAHGNVVLQQMLLDMFRSVIQLDSAILCVMPSGLLKDQINLLSASLLAGRVSLAMPCTEALLTSHLLL